MLPNMDLFWPLALSVFLLLGVGFTIDLIIDMWKDL